MSSSARATGPEVDDPYFGGAGPRRAGCIHCARCFTGCPHNAKNTTPKNYLYLAEQAGAQVHPLTTVTDVRPSTAVATRSSTVRANGTLRRGKKTYTAEQVVFSAAALGTQKLLHKLKDNGTLPELSPRLGELTRTNSEEILGAVAKKRADRLRPGRRDHVVDPPRAEHARRGVPLRQGPERAVHADGRRWSTAERSGSCASCSRPCSHPVVFLRSLNARHASERSVLLLVMQSLDNSLTSYRRRGTGCSTKQGTGEPNPDWIPIAHDIAQRFANKIDGDPHGCSPTRSTCPATAHYIGGCRHRHVARGRRHRPLPTGVRLPGSARRDGSAITRRTSA